MKKILMFVLALSLAMSAAGCMQKIDTGSVPASDPRPESSKTEEISSEPPAVSSSEPASELSSLPEPEPEEGEVTVFDPETQTTETEIIEAEEDLDTARVNALNGALGLAEYPIIVNNVTLKDGGLTIDLDENSAPLVGVGSSGEAACLKSIAVTFLKNYPEAELVYFTVEGGIYSSGHIEFAPGEPYMDRSMIK